MAVSTGDWIELVVNAVLGVGLIVGAFLMDWEGGISATHFVTWEGALFAGGILLLGNAGRLYRRRRNSWRKWRE